MTQRSTLRAENLSITNGAVVTGNVAAGSFSVPGKFSVDSDGNVDADGIVTAAGFAGPGVGLLEKYATVYSDFSDAGATFDLDLGELSGTRDAVLYAAMLNVTELFDGPGMPSHLYLRLGHAGDPDAYLLVVDAHVVMGWKGLNPSERGIELFNASSRARFAILPAGDHVYAQAEVNGIPALSGLTTGACAFYLFYSLLP